MAAFAIFLSVLAILGIIAVAVVYHIQIIKTKAWVKGELRQLTSMINESQLKEFKFDKKNESNIKILEQKLQQLQQELQATPSTVVNKM
jgi:type II secretory pathway pseudopilin PulG